MLAFWRSSREQRVKSVFELKISRIQMRSPLQAGGATLAGPGPQCPPLVRLRGEFQHIAQGVARQCVGIRRDRPGAGGAFHHPVLHQQQRGPCNPTPLRRPDGLRTMPYANHRGAVGSRGSLGLAAWPRRVIWRGTSGGKDTPMASVGASTCAKRPIWKAWTVPRWRRGRDCRTNHRNPIKSGISCKPDGVVCTSPVSRSRPDFAPPTCHRCGTLPKPGHIA
ncbi:MAG: hypothetical protein QOF22_1356, partial [Bradyrhizobium sp.]|nr:hypothetical protein [Bradyrhizobium sp.]